MVYLWQQVIQEYQADNYLIYTREDLARVPLEKLLVDTSASQSTQTLLRLLADSRVALWDAFVHSIQCVHPKLQEGELFAPLKVLIEHVTHLAVVYGEDSAWKSPDKWSYLMEVTGLWRNKEPGYFLLHPPATLEHIYQVEAFVDLPLPPTFVRFLLCTNGLGLCPQELFYIRGVGEARACWPLVRNWDRPSYHEIASDWWQWQEIYADLRRKDEEEGIIADRRDEQVSLPFAFGSDDWCFDHSQPDEAGEYPVLYWDHELRLREEDLEYPSFEAWFLVEVIRGKFFEEGA